MGRLADQAFTDAALRRAWSEVLANDAEDGQLGTGVARFEADLDDRIGRLVADLAWGSYQPRDLTEVPIDEPGKVRILHIPAVADRVVERAVLDVVTPYVDPVLGPAAYAYRPGLGVQDAVQELARLRDEGLGWVLRTDVDECFPTIPVPLARRMLAALVDDPELLQVIDLLLARASVSSRRGRRTMRGLAQGCALSPLLCNLVLTSLDARLLESGFALVRYADDLAVATGSRDEAWEALRCAAAAVEELGMALGDEDTHVMSFDEGFTFLGEDFGRRYPPVMADARVDEPERKVVYVAVQGSRARVAQGRLVVESPDDQELLDVPTGHVRRLVCFGSVGISAGVRSWAMTNDVDVVFASRRGSYLGALVSGDGAPRADRIRAQVAIAGTPRANEVSRAIVAAKVGKQITLLQRFGRREHSESIRSAVSHMQGVQRLLSECSSPTEAMGVEGAAAAAYFPALGSLLPEPLQFSLRSRQPPMDVANSALSFLYTVLLGECVTAVYAAGLDPGLGVLHADHERRPSLALDLLEEFRPLVVDQVVLEAARHGRLSQAHGRSEEGRAGVYLTRAGREVLLEGYERRMLTRIGGGLPGFAGTIRRHVYRQAQRLQAVICRDDAQWTGLSWR